MRACTLVLVMAAALGAPAALLGCGGGGGGGAASHPAEVQPGDVDMPADLEAGMTRLEELLGALDDPLKVGKELHTQRPVADEIAIVAEGLSGVAAKSHPPAVVANVEAKGKTIAKEARRLAQALRKKDAGTARAAHTATAGLVRRLKNELPRAPAEDE